MVFMSKFKLFGIIIANKLNFSEQCLNIKKLLNRKLYSIKRLFYLSKAVDIQFLKHLYYRILIIVPHF